MERIYTNTYIEKSFCESITTKQKIIQDQSFIVELEKIASVCIHAYQTGKKLLACGNGGSASDAMHLVAELMGRYEIKRKGLPAISLNANVSVLTAIANDYSYPFIFSKQVEAIVVPGDILVAISTSGSSTNVVEALKRGKQLGAICIGLTGMKEGAMDSFCDYKLKVPSNRTATIQEVHILLIHILCGLIEEQVNNLRSPYE